MLRDIGIEVRVTGVAHLAPLLLVANHVSWLDIPVLHASAPQARFVSKAAVERWPLVGTRARARGTLFIERESKPDALRAVNEVTDALRAGATVAVFLEGATGQACRQKASREPAAERHRGACRRTADRFALR
jgi:1-acyl-sn-glycerol-3-phosphate acyltransferase